MQPTDLDTVSAVRIAVIAHHVAPIAHPFSGGVEAMTWTLCSWLSQRGHEVELYAPSGSCVSGVTTHDLALAAPISGLARRDMSMPPARFMDAHYAYQRLMLELAQTPDRYDVIHSHSLHYLPVAMSQLLRRPMVLTVHCPPTPWLEAALASAPAHSLRPVVVSEATRQQWSATLPSPVVIRNGVDLTTWQPGPGGVDVVWSGRIVPEKAPHLAVRAALRAGRRIQLAGPILDQTYWARSVAPLLGDRARYAGHLGHDELSHLVSHSAVLVASPEWDEPFGLVAAEAMASGTPVAAFDRGGLGEVVGRDGGVRAAPGDVESLARAIREAATMSRARVRRHAGRALDIDTAGLAYERVYQEVAPSLRRVSRLRDLTHDRAELARSASVA